jgi:hypothetical protein
MDMVVEVVLVCIMILMCIIIFQLNGLKYSLALNKVMMNTYNRELAMIAARNQDENDNI